MAWKCCSLRLDVHQPCSQLVDAGQAGVPRQGNSSHLEEAFQAFRKWKIHQTLSDLSGNHLPLFRCTLCFCGNGLAPMSLVSQHMVRCLAVASFQMILQTNSTTHCCLWTVKACVVFAMSNSAGQVETRLHYCSADCIASPRTYWMAWLTLTTA